MSEEKRITIILTTNPSPTIPDTAVIRPTLLSLSLIDGLSNCKIIITFDGYRLWKCNEYKKGRLTLEKEKQYCKYKKNVEKFIQEQWKGESLLLYLKERMGFGLAILEALNYVTTPYVFIIQHDWQFIKPLTHPLSLLLNIMDKYLWIRYIGFSSSSSTDYSKRLSATKIQLTEEVFDTVPLMKLLFWYDKNHICRTEFYRTLLPGLHRGNFIEDVIGQKEWKEIKTEGILAHKKYGTYLYYPNQGKDTFLYHAKGRTRDAGISMHTCPVGWSRDQECTFTFFRGMFISKENEAQEEKIDEKKEESLDNDLSIGLIDSQHQVIEVGEKGICPYFLKGFCKFDAHSCSRNHYVYSRSSVFTLPSLTAVTSAKEGVYVK